jgi:integrase
VIPAVTTTTKEFNIIENDYRPGRPWLDKDVQGSAGRHRERTSLVLATVEPISPTLSLERIRAFQRESLAPSTQRSVRSHWKAFVQWCTVQDFTPLPAEPLVVAAYLAHAADLVGTTGEWFYAAGTLSSWLSAINKAHDLAGFPKPGLHTDVATTMVGIRRERIRPIARKAPLVLGQLRRTLDAIDLNSWPRGVIGHRDWAILLLGFAGAYRRSELASLELRDVQFHEEDGLHILLRQSKTDQNGLGVVKGLPFGADPALCAPCAYARWIHVLAAAEVGETATMRVVSSASATVHVCRESLPQLDGRLPLFRPVMKNGAIQARHITGNVVNDVVQRRVQAIGMNAPAYGAHSLRAGFVTEAFRAGATHHEVMRQTGHRDPATVEIYAREGAPLENNAVMKLGM